MEENIICSTMLDICVIPLRVVVITFQVYLRCNSIRFVKISISEVVLDTVKD